MQSLPANCRLHRFAARSDPRGSLVALEAGREVPFDIGRVYYLYGTPAGEARGFHGHRELEQMAVCLAGAVTITLDDGRSRREVRLDRPDMGLHIGKMIWREMSDFTDDAVLMVIASLPYDEGDYIRSYDDFLAAAAASEGGA